MYTFKDYLMELMVSDDPKQAMQDVRMAAKNPNGYAKVKTKEVLDNKKEIMGAKDDPNKSEKMRVNDSERKLLAQKKALADKEKRQGSQEGGDMNMIGDTGERPSGMF